MTAEELKKRGGLYFEKIQERIVNFVCENSKIRPETFRELMLRTGELTNDVGSVVYGKDAVELGLCDALGSLHEALSCLHAMIRDAKAPQTGEETA